VGYAAQFGGSATGCTMDDALVPPAGPTQTLSVRMSYPPARVGDVTNWVRALTPGEAGGGGQAVPQLGCVRKLLFIVVAWCVICWHCLCVHLLAWVEHVGAGHQVLHWVCEAIPSASPT
jgi:hypothetical protein